MHSDSGGGGGAHPERAAVVAAVTAHADHEPFGLVQPDDVHLALRGDAGKDARVQQQPVDDTAGLEHIVRGAADG